LALTLVYNKNFALNSKKKRSNQRFKFRNVISINLFIEITFLTKRDFSNSKN